MQDLKKRYGSWALVTGASSGIGVEFARQLGKQGIHLVIVARRADRLHQLAEELTRQYNIEVRPVAVDLTAPDYLETITAATADIEIGLLVLNAGAALPGAFHAQPVDGRMRNIHLNVTTPVEMTHHFGQKMVGNQRGGIILLASMVAYTGAPYMASYAASKSFILQFAEALSVETAAHNVDVLAVCPGATRTEMVEIEDVNMTKLPMPWMQAQRVAAIGLKNIGRKSAVITGKRNKVMTFMMTKLTPRRIALKMFGKMMKTATADHLV